MKTAEKMETPAEYLKSIGYEQGQAFTLQGVELLLSLYSAPLTTEIDRLKKENERARELLNRVYTLTDVDIPFDSTLLESIQSFLNESKPQK